jgi:endonuclease YncB( thermonuclease family)
MSGGMLVLPWLLPFLLVRCWAVTAEPIRAVDGDTIDARLATHLGRATDDRDTPGDERVQQTPERIRLLAVDAPERGQAGYEAARNFTGAWIARGPFTVAYCARDSFGRLLATVTRDTDDLGDALLKAGHAVPR